MFRLFLIVALTCGIIAKPSKPWNTDAAVQDTVVSIDAKGKMSWGVEVEPPQDMDEGDYDIDPRMIVWKSMTGGQDGKHLMAEKDLDKLYHPSMLDLQKLNIPATDIHSGLLQEDTNARYDEPEKDMDDIAHPFSIMSPEDPKQDWDEIREVMARYLAPLVAKTNTGTEIHKAQMEPEEDEDDLYHEDSHSPEQMEQVAGEVREVRVHLQPEEDMDDLYHADHHLQPILYHDESDAATPVDGPFHRKYDEPEEDQDDLYHQ
ncbi:hypothetical protein LDENG_00094950 [Lucifuga dentata]|nr:hypothetical protein LDENG_00094950 [Lucifuga dentata]